MNSASFNGEKTSSVLSNLKLMTGLSEKRSPSKHEDIVVDDAMMLEENELEDEQL